jgi:hypothetical protein
MMGSDMLFENKTGGYGSCFIFRKLSCEKLLTYDIRILNKANMCKYQMLVGQ